METNIFWEHRVEGLLSSDRKISVNNLEEIMETASALEEIPKLLFFETIGDLHFLFLSLILPPATAGN